MNIVELRLTDLRPDLLDRLDRRQEVVRCWRKENSVWALKLVPFIDDWTLKERRLIVEQTLAACIDSGGGVWAVVDTNGDVCAFSALSGMPLGSRGQYRQLVELQVSAALRGQGLGKQLFRYCSVRARQIGAAKLYISAHSAEETVGFYLSLGCIDALEPDARLVALEPCDRQLEYLL